VKNFTQRGDVGTVIAPTCGLSSGEGIVIGNLFGIYATDACRIFPIAPPVKAAGTSNTKVRVRFDRVAVVAAGP
jgi:hypothetical protein